jgi:hypothetical protein
MTPGTVAAKTGTTVKITTRGIIPSKGDIRLSASGPQERKEDTDV